MEYKLQTNNRIKPKTSCLITSMVNRLIMQGVKDIHPDDLMEIITSDYFKYAFPKRRNLEQYADTAIAAWAQLGISCWEFLETDKLQVGDIISIKAGWKQAHSLLLTSKELDVYTFWCPVNGVISLTEKQLKKKRRGGVVRARIT